MEMREKALNLLLDWVTDHNCILTMFGECSYNETGCSDCVVAEKIRKAFGDAISRSALISFIDTGHLRNPNEKCYSENDVIELIKNAPPVVPKDHSGKSTEMVGELLFNL